MEQSVLEVITLAALPVIFALTFGVAAKGFVAHRLGDRTALEMGRLTLNPAPHIDLLGTLIIPMGMLAAVTATGGLVPLMIGWAKPLPLDLRQLHDPKRQLRYIALAQPIAMLLLAVLWGLLLKLSTTVDLGSYVEPMSKMALYGIQISVMFATVSLLPILPFPGGQIVFSLLPHQLAFKYAKLEPYGNLIVVGLVVARVLTVVLVPAVTIIAALVLVITGNV